jgi:iron complex transport system permease protein
MATILLWTGAYSLRIGAVDVPDNTIYNVTLDRLSRKLNLGWQSDLDYNDRLVQRDSVLIINIRLPRVLMAGIVGAGLAMAGASLQGVFRNPLAEPSLIGVSSGAAVGAVTALAYDYQLEVREYELGTIGIAFISAMLSTALVYRLAYNQRRTDATTMLLIGVAVNAIAAAYIGLLTFRVGQAKVGDIVFWTLGSLGATTWREVEIVTPIMLLAGALLLLTVRDLNVMALGEAEAGYLGVNVQRLRLVVIALSALMTGLAVAFVGIIGFVGLVVPHCIRLLLGPDHRLLLPASFLGGAIFLIAMDNWARTIVPTSEVPLGVVTTLVGGPFFLLIILYNRWRGRTW